MRTNRKINTKKEENTNKIICAIKKGYMFEFACNEFLSIIG